MEHFARLLWHAGTFWGSEVRLFENPTILKSVFSFVCWLRENKHAACRENQMVVSRPSIAEPGPSLAKDIK